MPNIIYSERKLRAVLEESYSGTSDKGHNRITSEQRTRFNVPNEDFPNTLLTKDNLTKWPENNRSQTCLLYLSYLDQIKQSI